MALFDTPLPSICDDVDVDDDARFLCDLVNFANCFAGTKVRRRLRRSCSCCRRPNDFRAALAEANRQGTIPADAGRVSSAGWSTSARPMSESSQDYQPRPLVAPVHLFVPRVQGGLAQISGRDLPADKDHGWSASIGQEVTLHTLPGDHFSMMLEEGGVTLASDLAALLRKVSAAKDRQPAANVRVN